MRVRRSDGGMTLVEVLLATAMLAALLASVYQALACALDDCAVNAGAAELEGQARRVVDRLAEELAGAGLSTLVPPATTLAAPAGGSTLGFCKSAGWSAGRVVWGPPTLVAFAVPDPRVATGGGQVVVTEDSGAAGARPVVWTGGVASFLDGETANGRDDNLNGLVDERGLSFQLTGSTLTIRLTLERPDPRGRRLRRTVQTTVKLRN